MSTLKIDYKDPITIVETKQDGYGDNAISHVEHTYGLFNMGSSQSEASYVESLATDANVYLDIENPFVQAAGTRLEGMYIIANPFGIVGSEQWYKISSVQTGQDKLLTNQLDNIHCFLTKCDALEPEIS